MHICEQFAFTCTYLMNISMARQGGVSFPVISDYLLPNCTFSTTNGIKLSAEKSRKWAMRIRPRLLRQCPGTSTPTTIFAFLKVCRPITPCSFPPMKASSISTGPSNGSRPARIIARRSLCNHAQAVW
ncbi:MAG: hypothetical protein DDT41_00226 [candidate division WS2 bacterium]|nr:hypothetical protein [Candidatus Psychracetigena formicireducens]